MATAGSSPRFMRLANAWRLLALRSDVDDIILELLGRFSLEKIYSDADKESYQRLVSALLIQLDAIFFIQRLSLPSEAQQSAPYLGFLVSWEVAARSVEFVLQTFLENREGLWDAQTIRDKYLARFLLNSLRVLALHPRTLGTQRVKDRRDRFARIHCFLERLYDNYPGPKSFLLSLGREVTRALRTEPSSLALPSKLRYELPTLASELYPLPECLSPEYVSGIVAQNSQPNQWLPFCLALRDVAHFVVAASIQYTVKGECRDVRLQASSVRTRNAVLAALDGLHMPPHLPRVELVRMFGDIFQIILPDTPSLTQAKSSGYAGDAYEVDALDALCRSLLNRQVLHRVSDRQMMHSISEITRSISLLDDPSGQNKSMAPRVYVLNCQYCHIAGETQLNYTDNLRFPDPEKGPEIKLPVDTKCVECGEVVTFAREISLVRRAWALLKPLQPNTESISAERHLPDQFQLLPPENEAEMASHSAYAEFYGKDAAGEQMDGDSSTHRASRLGLQSPRSPDLNSMSQRTPSAQHQLRSSPKSDTFAPEGTGFIDETTLVDQRRKPDRTVTFGSLNPISPVPAHSPARSDQRQPSPPRRERPRPTSFSLDRKDGKRESKSKWGLHRLGLTRRDSVAHTADSSSISSNALDQQKLEEISLKALVAASKSHSRGKGSINVALSPNSTRALFWTPASIQIWDVGTSPPTFTRAISTENTCLMAAVTKSFLAYIVGPRDQKLTLRIINLTQADARIAEYHMPSSLWCRNITISPHETYVVVGFDNATVRFFNIENSAEPREQNLHTRQHAECKDCPPVETLSFSHDGLVLTASTRSPKTGLIQVYVWKYPFIEPSEVPACRYRVPLHESEDNGISSVVFRPKTVEAENLICITTWTQSGAPILVQPEHGRQVDIGAETLGHQRRLGNRIQCALFSPSGRHLIMVNDKGSLYQVSNLNSSLMEAKKLATSKEFTAKSDSFAMAYMSLHDEDSIVLAWAEAKGVGYVKKIPVLNSGDMHASTTADIAHVPHPELPGDMRLLHTIQSEPQNRTVTPQDPIKNPRLIQSEIPGDRKRLQKQPVELAATDFKRRT
ncbi:hypothetical protein VTO42DRAFT_3741 [Malbranchea cinnamomea]